MLFRSKTTSPKDSSANRAVVPGRAATPSKGHPTPKRKTSEAANKRPLVPADRKAAGKSARVASRVQRDREYQAMQTGDERFLPAKDKGPVRRYARDYVDARRNLAEFFLPVAMVFFAVTYLFKNNQNASLIVLIALYVIVLATMTDMFVLWRRLKKLLVAKFGSEVYMRGLAMYALMRALQIRRGRLPKPQVKHGEYPV